MAPGNIKCQLKYPPHAKLSTHSPISEKLISCTYFSLMKHGQLSNHIRYAFHMVFQERWNFLPRAHRILPRATVAARAGFGDEWENYGSTTYSYVGFLRPSCIKNIYNNYLGRGILHNMHIVYYTFYKQNQLLAILC